MDNPHTPQTQKSERIASSIMRILAIVGLVAVLALIAWVIVQGIRLAPQTGGAMSAAVSSLTSLVRPAPETSLTFDLDNRSLVTGQVARITWVHLEAVEGEELSYTFSYSCNRDARLSVLLDTGWKDLACDEGVELVGTTLSVIPAASETRFTDVELSVVTGELADTTLVTVVNTGHTRDAISSATSTDGGVEDEVFDEVLTVEEGALITDAPEDTSTSEEAETTTVVEAGSEAPEAVTVPAPAPVVPTYRAPADLAVNIAATGVYVDVAGRDTFFAIDPIPSDKRAGVVFTVTNLGELPSGAWAFVAELPIEGDADYRYTSPAQDPLLPNMQVEFTLGFDEVLEGKGAIRIELVPTQDTDRPANNIDAVSVTFE